jgi:hypothetical protein
VKRPNINDATVAVRQHATSGNRSEIDIRRTFEEQSLNFSIIAVDDVAFPLRTSRFTTGIICDKFFSFNRKERMVMYSPLK